MKFLLIFLENLEIFKNHLKYLLTPNSCPTVFDALYVIYRDFHEPKFAILSHKHLMYSFVGGKWKTNSQ